MNGYQTKDCDIDLLFLHLIVTRHKQLTCELNQCCMNHLLNVELGLKGY